MKSKDFASVKKYLSTVEEMQKALSVGERAFCSSICDAIDIEIEKYNDFLNKGIVKFNKKDSHYPYYMEYSYYKNINDYYLRKDVILAKIENLNKIKCNLQKNIKNFNEIDFNVTNFAYTESVNWFNFDEIKNDNEELREINIDVKYLKED